MFHGSMVALVTPMTESGEVEWDALSRLIEFHIDQGTDAIVAVGTTGESATLDTDEHCQVVKRVVKLVAARIPVIAGTGSNSTQEAIGLTQSAMDAGADACLLVTPYYNKPSQEGLYQHHKAIAEAVAIPQILYNVPGRTACDMLPETVERLSNISNIIGIKEATASIQRSEEILGRCGERLDIYSGDDATALQLMKAGAKGIISVTANVAPKLMHDMCSAALAGNWESAAQIDRKLELLHRDLFLEANPIPVKWALFEMGMIPPNLRLPLTPLAEEYHEPVRRALIHAGVQYLV